MELARRIYISACISILVLGSLAGFGEIASAQSSTRVTVIIVPYTEYEYWLIRWGSNEILCHVLIDHDGLPTVGEVDQSCGTELADEWWATPPCKTVTENDKTVMHCSGLYLHHVSTQTKEREVIVELPLPVAWVNLEECTPLPPENLCPDLPVLVLTGEEPLPNEEITAVQGTYEGTPFYCDGNVCKLRLRPTTLYGATVEFWVESSYGDTSEHYTALVRVVDTGVSQQPDRSGWYVDVVSTQWVGAPLSSCARIWQSLPSVGTSPIWLSTPERFELLASSEPYYYLAGRLIAQGLVDVSSCPSNGLLSNGYADTCGLEMAKPFVQEWQNQFDNRIIEVSQETGIPAQLLKNLFAQESQFWPGVFRVPSEYGLGQITESGADAVFLWNQTFFQQFCPLVLSDEACNDGYLSLNPDEQAILRGALALQARADCPDCPTGIDLTNVNFTVSLFANTLHANCAQVNASILNATGLSAGMVSTYEDLWRFTIANYHAGPGCSSFAIHRAWETTSTGRLLWDEVKNNFTEPCQGVIPYVDTITQ